MLGTLATARAKNSYQHPGQHHPTKFYGVSRAVAQVRHGSRLRRTDHASTRTQKIRQGDNGPCLERPHVKSARQARHVDPSFSFLESSIQNFRSSVITIITVISPIT